MMGGKEFGKGEMPKEGCEVASKLNENPRWADAGSFPSIEKSNEIKKLTARLPFV
jgi:hypothetical protein